MFGKLLIPVAALVLASQLAAQSQTPIYKAVAPQFAGVYDPHTGTLDRSAVSPRLGPDSIYNNNTLTNYYSVPGIDQEWIDEGQLCDRGANAEEQINGFNFTYCSTEADPTQNGGTFTFAFYDEFIICTGPSNGGNFANGGYLCAYDIVGLPLGDPNGVIQCWIVTIDLMFGFECPNVNAAQACWNGDLLTDESNGKLFGWGIIPRNNNTGPWLSQGGKGADNAFVWFDQFGIFQGCFWFGGTPFASFAIQLFGPEANCRAINFCNPKPNDDLQLNVNVPSQFQRTFNIVNPQQGECYWLLASFQCTTLCLPTGCTILVDPFPLAAPPIPMPNNSVTVTAPGAIGEVYFQAVCTADPPCNPPSPANLPVRASNKWCENFQ